MRSAAPGWVGGGPVLIVPVVSGGPSLHSLVQVIVSGSGCLPGESVSIVDVMIKFPYLSGSRREQFPENQPGNQGEDREQKDQCR